MHQSIASIAVTSIARASGPLLSGSCNRSMSSMLASACARQCSAFAAAVCRRAHQGVYAPHARLASSSSATALTAASLTAATTTVRTDNLLSQFGFCSRRESRQFCRNNEVVQVLPDGRSEPILVGSTKVDPARVLVNGEPLEYAGTPLNLAMHKPAGVSCSEINLSNATGEEEEGRSSIYTFLLAEFLLRKPYLSIVGGALEREASGLLLLSQSKALANRLSSHSAASPAAASVRTVARTYTVMLQKPLSSQLIEAEAFASGSLQLVDGHSCKAAFLTPHKDPALRNVCKVTLFEERNHQQLRRMFAAVGHQVLSLHRHALAGLDLAGLQLSKPGAWRLLREDELETVLSNSQQKGQRSQGLSVAVNAVQ